MESCGCVLLCCLPPGVQGWADLSHTFLLLSVLTMLSALAHWCLATCQAERWTWAARLPALSPGGDVRRQSGGWGGEKGGEMTVDQPGQVRAPRCACSASVRNSKRYKQSRAVLCRAVLSLNHSHLPCYAVPKSYELMLCCAMLQHVLERTSVLVLPGGGIEARFTVALPAKGRTVLGQWAQAILVQNLPRWVGGGRVGQVGWGWQGPGGTKCGGRIDGCPPCVRGGITVCANR